MARVQPSRRKSFRERAADWFTDWLGIDGGSGPERTFDDEGFIWENVESSNVEAVGWNPETSTLRIRFGVGKPATVYEYPDFPERQYREFLEAESKGQYVWYTIRNEGADNIHPYRKL